MPPGQDDNPFGTPRGAWGLQPPTTFGVNTPIKRPTPPSNQIRVPAPAAAPRNILTGGLVPQAGPRPAVTPQPSSPAAAEIKPAPAEIEPAPLAEPPDPTLVSDSVLARTSAAPTARVGGLPFPPVAGVGVLIAALVVGGLLLFRHPPAPPAPVEAPATVTPVAPVLPQAAVPAAAAGQPVADPPPAAAVRTVRAAPAPQPRRVAPVAETPAPITPPLLAAPAIVTAPPPPAPTAASPPSIDPEVPMTTRLPQ
ncbi:hypothetical protein JKL49_20085 [Phenylobacterium sp. 20VBR1]|uniref:Uncharacterized protein n=1 Tax=Phenylobacterium glaciei TaxID=2803784 RepID=A0A941D4F4_9CAUL|nr:hypothetical protein [Phenylobacterium glaciei]MBR7621702.1 hypothetical protein [Phenylobacterium glaciei]